MKVTLFIPELKSSDLKEFRILLHHPGYPSAASFLIDHYIYSSPISGTCSQHRSTYAQIADILNIKKRRFYNSNQNRQLKRDEIYLVALFCNSSIEELLQALLINGDLKFMTDRDFFIMNYISNYSNDPFLVRYYSLNESLDKKGYLSLKSIYD